MCKLDFWIISWFWLISGENEMEVALSIVIFIMVNIIIVFDRFHKRTKLFIFIRNKQESISF